MLTTLYYVKEFCFRIHPVSFYSDIAWSSVLTDSAAAV
jgi:hypothetical protein